MFTSVSTHGAGYIRLLKHRVWVSLYLFRKRTLISGKTVSRRLRRLHSDAAGKGEDVPVCTIQQANRTAQIFGQSHLSPSNGLPLEANRLHVAR